MTTTKFIDTNTLEILTYNQMKAHQFWVDITAPNPFPYSWPSSPTAASVDTIMDMVGGGLQPIKRYYELPYPALKIWEIAEIPESPDHVFIDTGDGDKYKTNWVVREKDSEEMKPINAEVAYILADAREQKLASVEVEVNGFYSNASSDTINAIISLMNYIKTNGEDMTVRWKGTNDADGYPRWKGAKMEDLQALHQAVEQKRQHGFNTEEAVFEEHLNNFIDYYGDVQSIYDAAYDTE